MNQCGGIKKARVEFLTYYSEKAEQDLDSILLILSWEIVFSASL